MRGWRPKVLSVLALAVVAGVAAPARAQSAPGGPSEPRPIDINTIDPDTFRAIAARLPEGQAPKIDGRMDDEVWTAGARVGPLHPARAAFRRAGHRAHRVPHPLRRPDALLRHLGVRRQSGRHHRERDEARFRPEQGRPDQDRPRHVSRSPQRVLLQHQPARRRQGRQLGRERPHDQLRLERGLGGARPAATPGAGTSRSRFRSASSASRRSPGETVVGPERLPDRPAQARRGLLGAVPARVGRHRVSRTCRARGC